MNEVCLNFHCEKYLTSFRSLEKVIKLQYPTSFGRMGKERNWHLRISGTKQCMSSAGQTKDKTSDLKTPLAHNPFFQPFPTISNPQPTRKHRILQIPCDQATGVESTTRPSTSFVHKVPPSQSLHSPARDCTARWYLGLGNSKKVTKVAEKKKKQDTTEHRLSVNPQGPPANVWHPFQLLVGAQGGYLAAAKPKIQCKQKDEHITYIWASHGTKSV